MVIFFGLDTLRLLPIRFIFLVGPSWYHFIVKKPTTTAKRELLLEPTVRTTKISRGIFGDMFGPTGPLHA